MRFAFVPSPDNEPLPARVYRCNRLALEKDLSRAKWRRQNEPREGGLYENAFLFARAPRIGGVRCFTTSHDNDDNDDYARNGDYRSGQDSGA